MLIILEGPDLAGKSTLANQLVRRIYRDFEDYVTLIHKGPPKSHPFEEYRKPLMAYELFNGEHIICDRWHIGEIIYPKITGRPTEMDVQVFAEIEGFLDRKGAVVVYVKQDEATLEERFKNRGDDNQSWENIFAASRAYEKFFRNHMTRLPVIYHTDLQYIIEYARFCEGRAWR